MPFGDVDRIAKLIPETLGITPRRGARAVARAARARSTPTGRSRKLFETARKLEGLTRHASTHAAGVVIGTDPLIETVPLYRDAKSGDVVTQFDMRCVEKIGLIKFDFLGLRTLTTIADAAQRVREGGLPDFDIEKIPYDDAKTYELLGAGDTEGVFQVESGGMTDLVDEAQAARVQGADPDRRALPARPARLGDGRGLHQPQERPHARSSTCCPSSRSSPPRRSA